MSNKTVEVLQAAFEADPGAISALIVNRVPCLLATVHNPFLVVDRVCVLPGDHYHIGALGLVNGVLAAHGLPLVAAKFAENAADPTRNMLVGFTEYTPDFEPAPEPESVN